ncbi:hypothetical protein M5K25_027772 [Dendrobium thyrsiflorum]|uniref:Uncharacterized protein n=1 Tax=Dendrobium thyrsiflorum TaxID=117978 RepID=A0ABD0TUW0_DENTH
MTYKEEKSFVNIEDEFANETQRQELEEKKDDEVEVTLFELREEDSNVDFFDEKRKITDIEEKEADWETLDSIRDEEGERAVHHNDNSNKNPISDDSADDF